MRKLRRNFTSEFKSKVAIAALYKVYYIITNILIIFPEKTWEEKYCS
jgi:hypothetical protein